MTAKIIGKATDEEFRKDFYKDAKKFLSKYAVCDSHDGLPCPGCVYAMGDRLGFTKWTIRCFIRVVRAIERINVGLQQLHKS
jgi:hypothetical protein